MTAFFELLNTYAIFFYIAGVVGVLLGIKMLFDARRAGRTTLFTLEQEQASDRAFRAVLVMAGSTLFIAAVAGINAFVSPVIPAQPTDVSEPTAIPFTPPVILPSATPQPTLTLAPATLVPATVVPTQRPGGSTPTAVKPTAGPQPTTPPETATPEPQPTTTSALIYAAPPLNVPPNGDSIGSNRIRFLWGMDAEGNPALPTTLTEPDRYYRLVINYVSKTTGQPAAPLVLCTKENSVDQRTGVTVGEYRNEAVDSAFNWNVTIVSAPSAEACVSGDFSPLSPPSSTNSFKLP